MDEIWINGAFPLVFNRVLLRGGGEERTVRTVLGNPLKFQGTVHSQRSGGYVCLVFLAPRHRPHVCAVFSVATHY